MGRRGLIGSATVVAAFFLGALYASSARADLCDENYDSVAAVIGNKNYAETVEVPYAHNDADAIRAFLIDKLCYREANIIELKDATFGKMLSVLGSQNNPQGQLWDWARPDSSNVFVYYSGHGAPDIHTGKGFLVPVDSDPDWPSLGLSLDTLVRNLKALKAERLGPKARVTLMLDACFSGKAATGAPLIKGSFTGWTPKYPSLGNDIIRISAAGADQIARWDEETKHGLLTSVFLDGVAGAADRGRMGDKDGNVTGEELSAYLAEEVPYLARRRYRDDQTPELPKGTTLPWRFAVGVFPTAAACTDIEKTVAGEKACLKVGDTFRDCPDCPEMVVISAGEFMMGSPDDEPGRDADEGPQHLVTIAKPFAMGKYEVTFAEWDACVADGGCNDYQALEGWGRGRRPVINVSWEDAQAYVKWLNEKTSGSMNGPYRLPSEAEWEYAARAGTTTPFWTGDRIEASEANFFDTLMVTNVDGETAAEVGSFSANPFGLHDVHGNVLEWVEDCYYAYSKEQTDGKAITTGICSIRVLRGGYWLDKPEDLRSAFRKALLRGVRGDHIGFRLARTLSP